MYNVKEKGNWGVVMLKQEIFIEKPITDVWEFIVAEYAKSFKCSPSQLKDKEIETTVQSFGNKNVKIVQSVQKLEEFKLIEVLSENSRDLVTTGYALIEDPDGTFLTTYESAKGKSSVFRTWNYKLFALPILRNSSHKRMRQRLETIKGLLEGTLDLEEE